MAPKFNGRFPFDIFSYPERLNTLEGYVKLDACLWRILDTVNRGGFTQVGWN
jgi:hypothetical protein